jgi:chemotaxis protein CheZ
MAKRMKFDDSGDSEDLQALFDTIAVQPARRRLEVVSEADGHGDSADLQALFDSVAQEVDGESARQEQSPSLTDAASGPADANAGPAKSPADQQQAVFQRIGHMARKLHDAMHELGYDKALVETARAMPDARQRLVYIAQMTEQAASRVLNATDVAKPIQDRVENTAQALHGRWERVFANQLSVDEFKTLATDTRGFLAQLQQDTRATNKQLTEIMMAQDFQDLTGQVIKKILEMAQSLEEQLVHLLVEVTPEEVRSGAEALLNGPVINGDGRTDVVTGQGQVDELLESLGF